MESVVIVLLVLLVLVGTLVGVAASRRRGLQEAPPEAPAPRPPTAPEARRPVPPEALHPSAAPLRDIEAEAIVREAEELLRGVAEAEAVPEPEVEPEPEVAPVVERARFRDRLGKARSQLAGYLGTVLSRTEIDDETWDELEEALIRADVGVSATTELLDRLRERVTTEGIRTPEALVTALKDDLKKTLTTGNRDLCFEPGAPNVWLFVGVNGVGKTTTIGKLGYQQAAAGRSVIMAAGDTFRAAAAEQLELWAKRANADLVRGAEGGDPGSVIFDAVERAAARGTDLVLADTAGRLHTKVNLMEELKKVRRVADRPPGRVTEVLLVIDATTGQNGLVQAQQFTDAVDLTGVVVTKLDGTAKGGIALAIQSTLGIPIKLVGLGESVGDLVDFDPDEFVEALLGQ
jgi:fused signal recognition particle receptor